MRMGLGSRHCAREEATDHWFRKTKFSRPDTRHAAARELLAAVGIILGQIVNFSAKRLARRATSAFQRSLAFVFLAQEFLFVLP